MRSSTKIRQPAPRQILYSDRVMMGNIILFLLYGDKFSEVSKKKRTTADVNHFRISKHSSTNATFSTPTDTWTQIVADNLRLRTDTKIEEKSFDVQVEDILFPSCIPNANARIVFSDFPGMNEAEIKAMYTDFVRKSWDSLDCAIVVMDASQVVNTEEQIELLRFVQECNNTHKNIPLVIVCNKVDDTSK